MTRAPARKPAPAAKAAPAAAPSRSHHKAPEPRLPGPPTPASAAATAPFVPLIQPEAEDDSPLGRFVSAQPLRAAPGEHTPHDDDTTMMDDALSADQVIAAGAEESVETGQETLEEAIARIGVNRKPLGSFSQKLAIAKRRGFHTHWFNDEGNRIAEALDAGWAHRLREGKPIKRAVGSGRDKGVLWAFAMDLPLFFWEQDLAVRHAFAESRMAALKASPAIDGAGNAQKSDEGKFYSPRKDHLTVKEGQRQP
jgi:hypothetical protein